METSERLFWQLLEERGLKHLEHFWHDKEIWEYKKLENLGPLPDFFVEKDGNTLLIEVKEMQTEGPRKRGRSIQTISHSAIQKPLAEPFRRAKKQLKPYAEMLGIPTLVVFFDTNGTHPLEKFALEMLFGEATFVINHDPVTGQGSAPVLQRGNDKQMSSTVGTYISAVGVLGFDLCEHLAAWINGIDDVPPRIRTLPNPFAKVDAPLHFFNGPKDTVHQPAVQDKP